VTGAPEILLVLLILVGAVWLFTTERFPIDLVALMVLGSLLLVGLFARPGGWIDSLRWISPDDGISGFSNPATITVGAMFVLSAALQKTGSVRALARMFVRVGRHPVVLLVLVMVTVGCVSMFINNTAAVAVFLPVVVTAAARCRVSASKLLIPMSFASQFGGVCTLIGSSTNLLVSYIAAREGYGAFGMFEMTRMGLILFAIGIVYFLVVGRWLLPARRGAELTEAYQLGQYVTELRVLDGSALIGKTVLASKLGAQHDVTVLEILREKEKLFSPLNEPIRARDVLLVRGKMQDLMDLKTTAGLELDPAFRLRDATLQAEDLRLVEVLVAPRSRLIGRTLAELDFRRRHGAVVLAIQRRRHAFREKLNSVRLRFGDTLLVMGQPPQLSRLRSDESFIVLDEVEEPSLRAHKAPLALGIIGLVVALAALQIVPIMVAAVFGCIAMVVTRCLTLEEAYAAIDWRVVFLLAGVLPLGIAMEKSGAAALISHYSVEYIGQFGPFAALATIYLLTAVLTECMSNNAAAILLAPIAISTAVSLNVNPRPFLMAVMFAASTSFATPVGYQTNAMIYTPGGYRFADFMKVGIPLVGLFFLASIYWVPKFWPF